MRDFCFINVVSITNDNSYILTHITKCISYFRSFRIWYVQIV